MKRIYTPARKKTILIVDDDQVVVHAYQNFQSHGSKVKVADNQHSVMQTLRTEPIVREEMVAMHATRHRCSNFFGRVSGANLAAPSFAIHQSP
jgi:ActR/RegA family two-component response regulator